MNFIENMFGYDLDCRLFEKNSGNTIREFKAREVTANTLSVDNVMGGIASYGRNRIIGTTELNLVDIRPKTHKIEVDGEVYSIVSVGYFKDTLPYQKKSVYEKVVTLE